MNDLVLFDCATTLPAHAYDTNETTSLVTVSLLPFIEEPELGFGTHGALVGLGVR